MSYKSDTDVMVSFLNRKASQGFLSEPVPSRYCVDILTQRVSFTDDEMLQVRQYVAKYHSVLAQVDYPMDSMFGEPEGQRTASLVSMMIHMMDDSGPEYVSANAARLVRALDSHKEQFVALEFELEFNK